MSRRSLAEMLVDFLDGMRVPPGLAPDVKITGLSLDLPVEVRMVRRGEDWELRCDVPLWRWRTDFDETPSRLFVRIGEDGFDERA